MRSQDSGTLRTLVLKACEGVPRTLSASILVAYERVRLIVYRSLEAVNERME